MFRVNGYMHVYTSFYPFWYFEMLIGGNGRRVNISSKELQQQAPSILGYIISSGFCLFPALRSAKTIGAVISKEFIRELKHGRF